MMRIFKTANLAVAFIIGATFTCMLASCTPEADCRTDDTNIFTLELVYRGEDSLQLRNGIRLVSLTIPEFSDITFVNDTAATVLNLPLNPHEDATVLVFRRPALRIGGALRTDTLIIGYDRTLYFEHVDCGLLNKYTNLEVLRNTFVFETEVLAPNVMANDEINVAIYFE